MNKEKQFNQELLKACVKGNLSAVKKLVRDGHGFMYENLDSASPIIVNTLKYGHLDILKYFHSKGLDLTIEKHSLLFLAVAYEHPHICEYLLSNGLNINYIEPHENSTPLEVALKYDLPKMACFLIDKGADFTQEGFSPLATACQKNFKSVITKIADLIDFNNQKYSTHFIETAILKDNLFAFQKYFTKLKEEKMDDSYNLYLCVTSQSKQIMEYLVNKDVNPQKALKLTYSKSYLVEQFTLQQQEFLQHYIDLYQARELKKTISPTLKTKHKLKL